MIGIIVRSLARRHGRLDRCRLLTPGREDGVPGALALPSVKLVVGLGNPGTKYQGTRHNIGFELVDRLARGGSSSAFSRKFEGLAAEIEIDYRRVMLLKPETFMNLSGRSVGQAVAVPQAPSDRHPGGVRRSQLASGQTAAADGRVRRRAERLARHHQPPRLGPVSPPPDRNRRSGAGRRRRLCPDPVPNSERPVIDDALILASQAVAVWVTQGIDAAMNRFNGPAAASS